MTTYGYIRTSRQRIQGTAGSDPAAQARQLRQDGVPEANIHRDVGISGGTGTNSRTGWRALDAKLAAGDTLVVVAIDRIGRCWPDTIRSICDLGDGGVKIRSLGGGPVDPLPGGRLRERQGLLRPDPYDVRGLGSGPGVGVRQAEDPGWYGAGPSSGKTLGPPRKLRPGPVEVIRRMRERGASLRRIAADFECSASTVLRALRQGGAVP